MSLSLTTELRAINAVRTAKVSRTMSSGTWKPQERCCMRIARSRLLQGRKYHTELDASGRKNLRPDAVKKRLFYPLRLIALCNFRRGVRAGGKRRYVENTPKAPKRP